MREKVLVVDDDPSFRRVLEYNLAEEGYAVFTAANGVEGLKVFENELPELVITDLQMPEMDGFQLLAGVKDRSPATLVIVITAFGAVDNAVQAMKLGAYDYITKPVNRDELKLVVKKALQLCGLSEENRRLREEISGRSAFNTIVGRSASMERVLDIVRKVADTDATVLLTGESGTGKEVVARALHALSSRRGRPFVAVNSAAIPRDLIESELFGHVKGAFTGAIRDKEGKFEAADGGTLFLDEIGELPLDLQPKLLRALQEREIEPVGGGEKKVDVRVVAATNTDLEELLSVGKFREDLYYRLSVIPLHLPPLRERRDDIPLLLRHFVQKHGSPQVVFAPEALERLREYGWPGNVRELENTVERMLIMRSADVITLVDLPEKIRAGGGKNRCNRVINLPDEGYPLEQIEQEVVVEALERNGWNQTAAARFLRIPRHTLMYRMEKYGIQQEKRK